jgi:putative ABC transport system ATP-binding protein
MTALELSKLKKYYKAPDGHRHCVINIAGFSLDRGEHVALEGASGSGKTTLLNLIAGIVSPDSGSIRVGDTDMAALGETRRDHVRASSIGYIHQTFNLLQGLSALENVLMAMSFGKGADEKVAASLLERVGLGGRMHHRPAQLSSGQQQRVAVVRALANRPGLVLADEVTSSLDSKLSIETVTLIRELCRENGAALLLASHDHTALSRFERTLRLEDINSPAETAL